MLCRHLQRLSGYDIVLASSSPRRKELLQNNLGLTFRVEVPLFKEDIDKSTCLHVEDYVSQTCRFKCLEIIKKTETERNDGPKIIISADTIISYADSILEKPANARGATEMLKRLSGNQHQVLTAVTLAIRNSQNGEFDVKTFCEVTNVLFSDLSEETIAAYVATGEPMDKAGSYGIQGLGSSLVERIDGCYFNVVGFPLHRFCSELEGVLLSTDANAK